MSARKTRARPKRKSAEEILRETLARILRGEVPQPIAAAFLSIVGRGALAAMAQSEAEAAFRHSSRENDTNKTHMARLTRVSVARQEAEAAGAALAKSLRAVKVPS